MSEKEPYYGLIRLAEEIYVPFEYFSSDNKNERVGQLYNTFTGAWGRMWEDPLMFKRCLVIGQWVVNTYPQAIKEWREAIAGIFDTNIQLLEEGIPVEFEDDFAQAYEEPFYRSDNDFYNLMRKIVRYPWENPKSKAEDWRAKPEKEMYEAIGWDNKNIVPQF